MQVLVTGIVPMGCHPVSSMIKTLSQGVPSSKIITTLTLTGQTIMTPVSFEFGGCARLVEGLNPVPDIEKNEQKLFGKCRQVIKMPSNHIALSLYSCFTSTTFSCEIVPLNFIKPVIKIRPQRKKERKKGFSIQFARHKKSIKSKIYFG